jgi:uncharacterized RmlC-like cupin family protein
MAARAVTPSGNRPERRTVVVHMSDSTCVVIDGGDDTYSGAQGFDYFEGVSAQTAGAHGLCMHKLVIPPGAA